MVRLVKKREGARERPEVDTQRLTNRFHFEDLQDSGSNRIVHKSEKEGKIYTKRKNHVRRTFRRLAIRSKAPYKVSKRMNTCAGSRLEDHAVNPAISI